MFVERMQELFGDRLKEQEPLSKHLNFQLGGDARYFVDIRSVDELKFALAQAKEANLKTFILGGGSNTLVGDEGFDGLVLKIAMRNYEVDDMNVMAEAGVLSVMLARVTAKMGLAGFTWAIGLPGTIGGAVRGNAGCFGGETRDHLVKVEVLRDGEVIELTNEQLQFGYRESLIKHNDDIVLRAWFAFEPGDPDALMAELQEKLESRKASQPLYAGSAGCMFKNYNIESQEEWDTVAADLPMPQGMIDMRRIGAGWLIDHLGLKGLQVGGAKVSEEHGNFLIKGPDATAQDVVDLVAEVKRRVKEGAGIDLEEEVKII